MCLCERPVRPNRITTRPVPVPQRNAAHWDRVLDARAREEAEDDAKREVEEALIMLVIMFTFTFLVLLPLHVLGFYYVLRK